MKIAILDASDRWCLWEAAFSSCVRRTCAAILAEKLRERHEHDYLGVLSELLKTRRDAQDARQFRKRTGSEVEKTSIRTIKKRRVIIEQTVG